MITVIIEYLFRYTQQNSNQMDLNFDSCLVFSCVSHLLTSMFLLINQHEAFLGPSRFPTTLYPDRCFLLPLLHLYQSDLKWIRCCNLIIHIESWFSFFFHFHWKFFYEFPYLLDIVFKLPFYHQENQMDLSLRFSCFAVCVSRRFGHYATTHCQVRSSIYCAENVI